MLPVTNLRAGIIFKDNGNIFKVLKYEHVKVGRGNAVIKLKIKNLKLKNIIEKTYLSGAKVNEAEAERRKCQYLYNDGENAYFMEMTSFEQFEMPLDLIKDEVKFLKDGEEAKILVIDGKPLSLEIPIKVSLKVMDTGPAVRGNSASGSVTKSAVLENNLTIAVPLFIKSGDWVVVDTRTGEYVERERKK